MASESGADMRGPKVRNSIEIELSWDRISRCTEKGSGIDDVKFGKKRIFSYIVFGRLQLTDEICVAKIALSKLSICCAILWRSHRIASWTVGEHYCTYDLHRMCSRRIVCNPTSSSMAV